MCLNIQLGQISELVKRQFIFQASASLRSLVPSYAHAPTRLFLIFFKLAWNSVNPLIFPLP